MKTHRVIWLTVLAALLGLGVIGFFVLRGRRTPLTAEEAYTLGMKKLEGGHLEDAYAHFDHAARLKPEESRHLESAARTAKKLGLIQAASRHSLEAWNRGLKNREMFEILVSSVTGNAAMRLERGQAWLRDLPEGRERRELEGDLHQSTGNYAECMKIWTELYDSGPSPALANKIALARVAAGEPEKAHAFLKTCLEGSRLDEEGFGMLASLAAYRGDTEEAASVFAAGRSKFGASESLRLNEAVFLIWIDRLAEAASMLEPLKARATDPAVEALHGHARIFLGFLRAAQADARALEALEALAQGEGPELEGERLFHRGLRETSVDVLKKAKLLLPTHPACEWGLAREMTRDGAWQDSLNAYRGVKGLLASAPALQIEMATALRRSGHVDEALVVVRRVHARRYFTKASVEMLRDLAAAKGLTKEATEAQAFLESKYKDDPTVALAGGLMALKSGNLSEAASVLDALSTRHPGRDDVEVGRLSVLFARKDYEGVLFAAKLSQAPAASLAPIKAASLAMLGRVPEAMQVYEQSLAEKRNPVMLMSYANLLLKLDKADRAAEIYGELVRLDPRNHIAHLGLASIGVRRRDWKFAREHVDAAASGPPLAYTHALRAEIDLELGSPDRALASCQMALGLSPKDERARFLAAVANIDLGKLQEADTLLRRLSAERPDHTPYQWQLARLTMAKGSLGEALAIVDGAIARGLSGTTSFQSLRFVLLARLSRWSEAREQLASWSADMAPAKKAICEAWLLQLEGKGADAAARLRDHLQDPHAALTWAELSLREGVSEGVLEALDRHLLDAARWGRMGELARQKNLMAVAAGCYRRAIRFDPDNAQLLNNYAYASLQLESFEEADVIAAARKACAAVPNHASVLHTYVSVLLRCKKERECLEVLEKSDAVVRTSARLLHSKATAHERLEQWAAAVKAYEACLAHRDTAAVTTGDLSRPSIEARLKHVRARAGNP